jgi:hypothetical protein
MVVFSIVQEYPVVMPHFPEVPKSRDLLKPFAVLASLGATVLAPSIAEARIDTYSSASIARSAVVHDFEYKGNLTEVYEDKDGIIVSIGFCDNGNLGVVNSATGINRLPTSDLSNRYGNGYCDDNEVKVNETFPTPQLRFGMALYAVVDPSLPPQATWAQMDPAGQ